MKPGLGSYCHLIWNFRLASIRFRSEMEILSCCPVFDINCLRWSLSEYWATQLGMISNKYNCDFYANEAFLWVYVPLGNRCNSCYLIYILTVLFVEQYFELILLLILERILQPSHRLLVCQLAVHEAASVLRNWGIHKSRISHIYEVLFLISFRQLGAVHKARTQI